LNTQFTRPATTEMAEMLTWLEEDLTAATQPWTIVFFHKAVYSRGNHHTGEENDGAINAAFTPIFDAHDVDLVLNGHSHDYERYAPTVGYDAEFGGSGRTFPAGDGSAIAGMMTIPDGRTGTTYLVTGGAGALTTAGIPGTDFCMDIACTYCLPFVNNCAEEVLDNDRDATVQFSGLHNYVVMDVDGPDIHVVAKSTIAGNSGRGGGTLDTFTIANSDWPGSVCDDEPMPGTDAGVPVGDAGAVGSRDAGTGGSGSRDAGTGGSGSRDAGTGGPGGGPGGGGADDGGCGCAVPGGPDGAAPIAWMLAALAVALYFRRSRR
jgi:MYXO-CTERM domain-containing protein